MVRHQPEAAADYCAIAGAKVNKLYGRKALGIDGVQTSEANMVSFL